MKSIRSAFIQAKRESSKPKFWIVPFSRVFPNSVFLPIEKSGKKIYKRDRWGRHICEKQWEIGTRLYRKDSNAVSVCESDGSTAIFALNDWAIVRSN